MEPSLITIVIPVYNCEQYLEKCLDSVVTQSYRNLEIIVINDGSTDSSLEICRDFERDPRIVIVDRDNQGLSSARQLGIDMANGEYLCTVDADDFIDKDFVSVMHAKISDDNSDICICETKFYSTRFPNYSNIWGFKTNTSSSVKITKAQIEENYCCLLGQFYMSDSWNKMYRLGFIKSSQVKFSLEKKYNGTDLLFNHLLLLHEPRISVVPRILYFHQILDSSRVRRKNKQLQQGFMIIIEEICREVDRLGYGKKINSQISLRYLTLLYLAVLDIENTEDKTLRSIKLYEFSNNNNQYIKRNARIDLKQLRINNFELCVFRHCLLNQSIRKLSAYIIIRHRLLTIVRKLKNQDFPH